MFTLSADNQIGVAYKIKTASELMTLDTSNDGNHLAFGLNDGSLIIKSKKLEKAEAEMDEEEKMMKMFEPEVVSKAKNYKYFFRGQYTVQPDPSDLTTASRKKRKLQPYEHHLKAFEYKQALTSALTTHNPEVIVALFEELVERDGLFIALGGRSETELAELMQFLTWKVSDYRYSNVLVDIARIVLNMYAGVVGMSSKVDNQIFQSLEREVSQQVELQKGLLELSGQIDMITRVASLK